MKEKPITNIEDVPERELLSGGSPLCSGCGAGLGLRMGLKVMGKNTILVNSAGCLTLLAHYPYMPVHVPWIHVAIENAGAVACGINAAYRQLKKKQKFFVTSAMVQHMTSDSNHYLLQLKKERTWFMSATITKPS